LPVIPQLPLDRQGASTSVSPAIHPKRPPQSPDLKSPWENDAPVEFGPTNLSQTQCIINIMNLSVTKKPAHNCPQHSTALREMETKKNAYVPSENHGIHYLPIAQLLSLGRSISPSGFLTPLMFFPPPKKMDQIHQPSVQTSSGVAQHTAMSRT
jgi:hypothetical protein